MDFKRFREFPVSYLASLGSTPPPPLLEELSGRCLPDVRISLLGLIENSNREQSLKRPMNKPFDGSFGKESHEPKKKETAFNAN